MRKEVQEALKILKQIEMPIGQQNERSALCLLAICNVTPQSGWSKAESPLIGITPIMKFAADHYLSKPYAPNTRETIRRDSMHQFVEAGVACDNPDDKKRPVNSPRTVYQISPEALALVRTFGTDAWNDALQLFKTQRESLAKKYSAARNMLQIPLKLADGHTLNLSPGEHSELIRQIVEVFGAHYAPSGKLIYVGDTGAKWGYFDREALESLGVAVDTHGKMPDAIIHDTEKGWLLLCEAVTSHGPVNGKRHAELKTLFQKSKVGLVFVTAFPSRAFMSKYLAEIAWETEVWCADNPTHLIHFNGDRFLGPYSSRTS